MMQGELRYDIINPRAVPAIDGFHRYRKIKEMFNGMRQALSANWEKVVSSKVTSTREVLKRFFSTTKRDMKYCTDVRSNSEFAKAEQDMAREYYPFDPIVAWLKAYEILAADYFEDEMERGGLDTLAAGVTQVAGV
jgi:hypothetical protein